MTFYETLTTHDVITLVVGYNEPRAEHALAIVILALELTEA